MRSIEILAAAAVLSAAGCALPGDAPEQESLSGNAVHGDYVEGCECNSVCPCLWNADATYPSCRAVFAWRIDEGSYQGTDLSGVAFAASLTKSGHNVHENIGKLEGMMFLPAGATEAQRAAIQAMMTQHLSGAFAEVTTKVTEVSFEGDEGNYHVVVDDVAELKTEPLEGKDGKVPAITNPPFPMALPVNYCATAPVHTYDDGTNKWSFTGRNSFYGPFEIDHG